MPFHKIWWQKYGHGASVLCSFFFFFLNNPYLIFCGAHKPIRFGSLPRCNRLRRLLVLVHEHFEKLGAWNTQIQHRNASNRCPLSTDHTARPPVVSGTAARRLHPNTHPLPQRRRPPAPPYTLRAACHRLCSAPAALPADYRLCLCSHRATGRGPILARRAAHRRRPSSHLAPPTPPIGRGLSRHGNGFEPRRCGDDVGVRECGDCEACARFVETAGWEMARSGADIEDMSGAAYAACAAAAAVESDQGG